MRICNKVKTGENIDCHERVNSLYVGSVASDTIQLALGTMDKESEWEDLDDSGLQVDENW